VPRECGTTGFTAGWFGGADEIEMRSVVDNYGVVETARELCP